MLKRTILLWPLLLLLSACTSLQQPTQTLPQKGNFLPAQQLNNWTAKGAIIINSPEESTHAHFNWQQHGQNYTIDFFGPLGTYHHQLIGSPTQVTLIDQQNRSITAKNPEELLKKTLGWELPVRNLVFWIRGIAKPQPGWNVQYGEYTIVKNYQLPKVMTLTYPNLNIKIKVDEWEI